MTMLGKTTGVAEDELYNTRKELEETTQRWINKTKDAFKKKEDEVMSI